MNKIGLLLIDFQVDFCEGGALPVPGALKDANRVATMIDRIGNDLYDIELTLDSHHRYHIAHALPWIDNNGNKPNPYTLISWDDVCGKNPRWKAVNPQHQNILWDYIDRLTKSGRYQHMIWPDHCLIGEPGHCLTPEIAYAIACWETKYKCTSNKITKGSYLFSEHFSAIQSEVQDPRVPDTQINMNLINRIQQYDILAWAGQAFDFCLANTFKDTINQLGSDAAKKMVILEDGTSSVNPMGSTALADDFRNWAISSGVQFTTTDKFLR